MNMQPTNVRETVDSLIISAYDMSSVGIPVQKYFLDSLVSRRKLLPDGWHSERHFKDDSSSNLISRPTVNAVLYPAGASDEDRGFFGDKEEDIRQRLLSLKQQEKQIMNIVFRSVANQKLTDDPSELSRKEYDTFLGYVGEHADFRMPRAAITNDKLKEYCKELNLPWEELSKEDKEAMAYHMTENVSYSPSVEEIREQLKPEGTDTLEKITSIHSWGFAANRSRILLKEEFYNQLWTYKKDERLRTRHISFHADFLELMVTVMEASLETAEKNGYKIADDYNPVQDPKWATNIKELMDGKAPGIRELLKLSRESVEKAREYLRANKQLSS